MTDTVSGTSVSRILTVTSIVEKIEFSIIHFRLLYILYINIFFH